MAEAHEAVDPNRTPVVVVRLPSTTPGVLHLDTTGVTGTSVVTADGVVTPLGYYEPRFEVLTGGTIGLEGIIIRRSPDEGRSIEDIQLGTATSMELPGLGVKINFAAGTLVAGDVVTGWTDPPHWAQADLPPLFTQLRSGTAYFSLLCIGEPSAPGDAPVIGTGLTSLEQYGRDVHAIITVRPRYKPTLPLEVEVTFDDTTRTITRAAGSWITDGVKVGMRATVSGTANNNGVFVRVTTITATVLTFSVGVVFVDEAAVTADLLFEETEQDYGTNTNADWASVIDPRISACADEIRALSPSPRPLDLDRPFPGELTTKLIVSPIDTEPGQVRQAGVVGGALAVALRGRIYDGDTRIHYDADADPTLATPPNGRFTVLRRLPDGRAGAFVNTGLTLYGSDSAIDTIVKARLSNEWKRIVRSALTDEILSGLFSDTQNPNKLSEGACQDIEARVLPALRVAFRGKISNLNLPPPNALFTVDRDSDLATNIISCRGKIITKFYPRGFNVALTVTQPGQV
jgi:hypothetical protein